MSVSLGEARAAPASWPPPNFVRPEYRGLARAFRMRIEAADAAYNRATSRIVDRLEKRLPRKPRLRDGDAIDVARAWKAIPHPYRLALEIDAPRPGHLKIEDIVLGATTGKEPHWNAPEKSVGVMRVLMSTVDMSMRVSPVATVCMHALGRYYERSGRRDDASLIEDVRAIVLSEESERIPCPRGLWLGSRLPAHTADRAFMVRVVRTFVEGDRYG